MLVREIMISLGIYVYSCLVLGPRVHIIESIIYSLQHSPVLLKLKFGIDTVFKQDI